jgi:ribA/ribD-fused uncharacterized protein
MEAEMQGRILFHEGRHYMLSNFSAHALYFNGIMCPTAEHAYQGSKFSQTSMRLFVSKQISPLGAKKVAHNNRDKYRKDWEEVKLRVMEEILRVKLATHSEVREALLATGQAEIVENSQTDSFWGWGPDRQGQNHLGKIWMKLRAELQLISIQDAS